MQSTVFEPMSVSRIFDTIFKIYKHNFTRFLAIVAIIHVPISLITIISSSLLTSSIPAPHYNVASPEYVEQDEQYNTDATSEEPEVSVEPFEPNLLMMIFGVLGMFIGLILTLLGNQLCVGALIKSVSEFYLGRDISVGQAYRAILPKFLKMVGAGLLVMLVIYAGLLMCVVPGIIFGLWFSLTVPVIIVENVGITDAMSRSKSLIQGNLGKVFGVGLLALVISFAINIPFTYGGMLISMIISENQFITSLLQNVFASIGQLFAIPISASAYILLYYDLRIRKEGFDLEMLAQTMEASQA